jgi:peptidoglycan glycosyltransferase
VNKQVSHIGIAALALLSALVIGTTYWQTWANAGLANRQDNDIRLVAQFTIKRGKIYASDGRTLLATNVTRDRAGQTLYFRRYPAGPIFSDVVGYSTQTRNRTGLEQSYNDYLTGSNANLDTVFRSALDKLKGTTVTGNDLVLTIRPAAQALALRLLRGKCGAVVALDPSTGRVLVMATSPTYNANLIEKRFGVATRTSLPCGAPLLNRATVGKYPPGSTFKMVTARPLSTRGASRFAFLRSRLLRGVWQAGPQCRQPGGA